MKKDLSLDDFKTHTAYIVRHTDAWVLRDVANMPLPAFGGYERRPVATSAQPAAAAMIIFPSATTAARLTGVVPKAIRKSIDNGTKCKGMFWRDALPAEYRNGVAGDYGAVLRILRRI